MNKIHHSRMSELQLSLDFEKELVLAFNYFSQKGFYYRCLTGS